MFDAYPNPIGLTSVKQWSSDGPGQPLDGQLEDLGIQYRVKEIPHLVGMGGNARLILYRSPKDGALVVVLVTPHAAADSCAETYYNFRGMDEAKALASEDWWVNVAYPECRDQVERSKRDLIEQIRNRGKSR